MDHEQKLLLRAAARIHAGFLRRRRNPQCCLPAAEWQAMEELARQIEMARTRGWRHAAAVRTEELASAAESCQRQVGELAVELRASPNCEPVATMADIYRDLLALRDEFEETSCDLEEHVIWATTAPIALEGIHLGRFEIRLDWERLNEPPAYRVVALEANPANTRAEVTHPHVCDEHLCEGDGTTAIRSALDQGRIGDFFLIVLNLLRTYAAGSAYVELDDWHGTPCSSCGSMTDDNSRYGCNACDCTLCGDCTVGCDSCLEYFCGDCVANCAQCNACCCHSCVEACSQCKAEVCPNCLEDDLCKACFDEQKTSEENHEVAAQATITMGPGVAVQPHGLGQAAVSARPRDERGRWIRHNAA